MSIRVLIVDDSPIVRDLLREAFALTTDLEVVGEASNGLQAVKSVLRAKPDVVTMDIVMPMMDGLEAIERIMAERPTPVVVVADAAGGEQSIAMRALGRGAVDVFAKPRGGFDQAAATRLIETIRQASTVRLGAIVPPAPDRPKPRLELATGQQFVGIVASTGGPRVLQLLLSQLPADFPHPIGIVQHTAVGFGEALVAWLDQSCALDVMVAAQGAKVESGQVVVAPDGYHLRISRRRLVWLSDSEPVDGHRPSGTVLLSSLAESFGASAVGMVLTGMGHDGAEGLARIEEAGGLAIVEDPESASVGGMPRAASIATRRAFVGRCDALASLLTRLAPGHRS